MTSQNMFYKVEISSSVDATEVYILKTPDASDILNFHESCSGGRNWQLPVLINLSLFGYWQILKPTIIYCVISAVTYVTVVGPTVFKNKINVFINKRR